MRGAAPLTREYRTNEVEALVQDYRKLQHRRLLILGEPGMGKTTLAILMLRWLLEHPEPGEPVPVFFSLSDWNLGAESRLIG